MLFPAYPGRSTVLVVLLSSELTSCSLPLRVLIEATPANGLATGSLALCDQLTCLLETLLGELFGRIESGLLAQLRQRGALALGLMPSDLRSGGG